MNKNHLEVGLALLAVAVVLAFYMFGFHFFASRVDSTYIMSLWTPMGQGAYVDGVEGRSVMASETDRATLRAAWRETLNHGDSLWNDMMWWAVVLVVLAVVVLVGSLGTSVLSFFQGKSRMA